VSVVRKRTPAEASRCWDQDIREQENHDSPCPLPTRRRRTVPTADRCSSDALAVTPDDLLGTHARLGLVLRPPRTFTALRELPRAPVAVAVGPRGDEAQATATSGSAPAATSATAAGARPAPRITDTARTKATKAMSDPILKAAS